MLGAARSRPLRRGRRTPRGRREPRRHATGFDARLHAAAERARATPAAGSGGVGAPSPSRAGDGAAPRGRARPRPGRAARGRARRRRSRPSSRRPDRGGPARRRAPRRSPAAARRTRRRPAAPRARERRRHRSRRAPRTTARRARGRPRRCAARVGAPGAQELTLRALDSTRATPAVGRAIASGSPGKPAPAPRSAIRPSQLTWSSSSATSESPRWSSRIRWGSRTVVGAPSSAATSRASRRVARPRGAVECQRSTYPGIGISRHMRGKSPTWRRRMSRVVKRETPSPRTGRGFT